MVKLRGINVYPTAVGEILKLAGENTGEFFCRVQRIDGRDEMTVSVECMTAPSDWNALAGRFRSLLKQKIGVDFNIKVLAPGDLEPLTEINSRQKPLRLADDRPKVS